MALPVAPTAPSSMVQPPAHAITFRTLILYTCHCLSSLHETNNAYLCCHCVISHISELGREIQKVENND